MNADEALQLSLALHRPRATWNDFIRIELALEQEQYFQSKALANQIARGKHKGLANLPKAQHIDVREKIADLAGVSPRTVGNVKIILKKAHPSLIEALHNGTITINGALEVCKFERMQQVEELSAPRDCSDPQPCSPREKESIERSYLRSPRRKNAHNHLVYAVPFRAPASAYKSSSFKNYVRFE
jgi:hypothetical protein